MCRNYIDKIDDDDNEYSGTPSLPSAPKTAADCGALLWSIISEKTEDTGNTTQYRDLWLYDDDGTGYTAPSTSPGPKKITNPHAVRVKELALYAIGRLLTSDNSTPPSALIDLLSSDRFIDGFLERVSKSKGAKVIRGVLDVVTPPTSECGIFDVSDVDSGGDTSVSEGGDRMRRLRGLKGVCEHVAEWSEKSNRSFLNQRVLQKLAEVNFSLGDYTASFEILNGPKPHTSGLLRALKSLDDKSLLVSAHLLESQIYFAQSNISKAKSSLTSSKSAAQSVYVEVGIGAKLDLVAGVVSLEGGEWDTAFSYFLEAFEQWDQNQANVGSASAASLSTSRIGALTSLRYMILCKILEGLDKACRGVGTKSKGKGGKGVEKNGNQYVVKDPLDDLTSIVTGVQFSRYNADNALSPLLAVGAAVKSRSLKEFYDVKNRYFSSDKFFSGDIIMRRHLPKMEDKILRSNLVRVLEPYSVVDLAHITSLIEGTSVQLIERKLGVLILDGVIDGVLDQGRGCIILSEENSDEAGGSIATTGQEIIAEVSKVVDTLLMRGQKELR